MRISFSFLMLLFLMGCSTKGSESDSASFADFVAFARDSSGQLLPHRFSKFYGDLTKPSVNRLDSLGTNQVGLFENAVSDDEKETWMIVYKPDGIISDKKILLKTGLSTSSFIQTIDYPLNKYVRVMEQNGTHTQMGDSLVTSPKKITLYEVRNDSIKKIIFSFPELTQSLPRGNSDQASNVRLAIQAGLPLGFEISFGGVFINKDNHFVLALMTSRKCLSEFYLIVTDSTSAILQSEKLVSGDASFFSVSDLPGHYLRVSQYQGNTRYMKFIDGHYFRITIPDAEMQMKGDLLNHKTQGALTIHPFSDVEDGVLKLQTDIYSKKGFFYRLPPHFANGWWASEDVAVTVSDFNNDGLDDIFIKTTYVTGIGAEGSHEQNAGSLYFQSAVNGFFYNFKEFDGSEVDINVIRKKVKQNTKQVEELLRQSEKGCTMNGG